MKVCARSLGQSLRVAGGRLRVFAIRPILPAVLLVATLLLAGCDAMAGGAAVVDVDGVHVRGSGNVITKEMVFADFSEIEIRNAFTVDVTYGETFGVAITADDNLFDYVEVYQQGRTLFIGTKRATFGNATWRAQVTLPSLERLDLAGASRATVAGFRNQEEMGFEVSGASKLAGRCEAQAVTVDVSGAGAVELGGSAETLDLEASGASAAGLGDLVVDRAEAVISGASRATVNVKSLLDANLSGASTLFYVGNPTLGNVSTSGASSLKRR